jgi:SHS family lactate transporter-like MFS transporter
MGACGGGMGGPVPAYLNERFPTEIRATATAFCYHQGAIWGGLVPPLLTYFATSYNIGFTIPMLIGACVGATCWTLGLVFGPETKGKVMVAETRRRLTTARFAELLVCGDGASRGRCAPRRLEYL